MVIFFAWFVKGFLMGIANLVPGLSGGTIAWVTGIYQRLINALCQYDKRAFHLLKQGKLVPLWQYLDLTFISCIVCGSITSILALSSLVSYLLQHRESDILAFFFGCIISSIIAMRQDIKLQKWWIWLLLISGIALSLGLFFSGRLQQNMASWYLLLCGIIAASSMILPGLSGSLVLLVMGNYQAILQSINNCRQEPSFEHAKPLLLVGVGFAIGVVIFSHVIRYLLRRFYQAVFALIVGFIIGSLVFLWPWRIAEKKLIMGKLKTINSSLELPNFDESIVYSNLVWLLLGIASVCFIHKLAKKIT